MPNSKAESKKMHPLPTEPALYGDRKRVAFVTGAAQGIGRALVLRLATDGFNLAINDLNSKALNETGDELRKLGAKVSIHVGDVSDEKAVETMVAECVKELRYLDVMVANAGIAIYKPLLEQSVEDFDKVLRINVRGVHLCYKHAAKVMIKQGTGGKLIAAGSVASYRGSRGMSPYAASKFAVRGYNQSAALELAPHGITANCYAPGFIDTPMVGGFGTNKAITQTVSNTVLMTPLRRMGAPEDVANLVSFLASRDSDYITGQCLPVSGGFHML